MSFQHCHPPPTASSAEMPAAPSTRRLFRFLPPYRRPQGTDIAAVAGWSIAGVATAVWLVQPFDWNKKILREVRTRGGEE